MAFPLASFVLAPLSFLYSGAVYFDRWIKEKNRRTLARPVVSVGNLTLGGTGKTPLLLKLIDDLKKMNVAPAVLTRGYRGIGKPVNPTILPQNKTNVALSDEVSLLLARHPQLSIGVGPDRVRSADDLLASAHVDVFVLDDGFQHWRLARQLDVVCISAADPFGGARVFPWGRLREPLRGLKRAQLVVITRSELFSDKDVHQLKNSLERLAPQAKVIRARAEFSLRTLERHEAYDLSFLQEKSVVALSGLGDPEQFEQSLMNLGAQVHPLRFPDHHAYSKDDLDRAQNWASDRRALIVMTEKDAVKIKPDFPSFVLKMDLTFNTDDEVVWMKFLDEIKTLVRA